MNLFTLQILPVDHCTHIKLLLLQGFGVCTDWLYMQSSQCSSAALAAYDAQLEGTILQHTAAVDYYLRAVSPSWTIDAGEHANHQQLHSIFLADVDDVWQALTPLRVG